MLIILTPKNIQEEMMNDVLMILLQNGILSMLTYSSLTVPVSLTALKTEFFFEVTHTTEHSLISEARE
jgi:hypothetical protein